MLKKYNFYLLIFLLFLIGFCLYNKSVMENMENSDANTSNDNNCSNITFINKDKESDTFNNTVVSHNQTKCTINGLGYNETNINKNINDLKNNQN